MSSTRLPRHAATRLRRLSTEFPVIVVTGARQVGKSTLLDMVFGHEADTVVFDSVLDVDGARLDPDLFLDSKGFALHKTPRKPRLILDEIQFAPQLLPAIKRRVDMLKEPGQFLLSGSQQWQVMKHVAESLAGRAVFVDLEGFTLAEIAGRGSAEPWLAHFLGDPVGFLEQSPDRLPLAYPAPAQVFRGFMPAAQTCSREALDAWFAGYLRTYLERDARAMTEVRDWSDFGLFVRLAAAHTTQELNASELGREVGLTPQTVRRWLGALTATFQWSEAPAFSVNASKRVTSRSKGYWTDSGVAAYLLGIPSDVALIGRREWGALFETAAVGELRRQLSLVAPRSQLFHYRAHGGAEVDVVIDHGGILFPIEIKAKRNPDRADVSGISAFRERFADRTVGPGIVLAPAERVYALTAKDWVVPWDLAGGPVRGADALAGG